MAKSGLERRLKRLEELARPGPTECTCTHDSSEHKEELDASIHFLTADISAHLLGISVTELPDFDEELYSRGKTAAPEPPLCDFCESGTARLTERELDQELYEIGLCLLPEPWRALLVAAGLIEK